MTNAEVDKLISLKAVNYALCSYDWIGEIRKLDSLTIDQREAIIDYWQDLIDSEERDMARVYRRMARL